MAMKASIAERQSAIHLLRAGQRVGEVAVSLGRSERWVRKWRTRYREEGWAGLQDRSRRPQHLARQTSEAQKQAICKVRSALEAEAAEGLELKYIGPQAVRTRLKEQGLHPLPSRATIGRVLRAAGMTRPYQRAQPPETAYPHLKAQQPQEHIQVDIVPHYLKGGERAACFNAIDVVSRYPTGAAYAQRRSQDAETFLLQVWQDLGVPRYTQVDNESCFSGGFTHPYVLGRVVRLALQAGTELVFSPVRHPQSNGFVERFHRDYNRHVWEDTYLADLSEVCQQADRFFARYRQRPHSRLNGQTPEEAHARPRHLPKGLQPTAERRPLYAGRVHFIRKVQENRTVSVLNVDWNVPRADPGQGVWVTLVLRPRSARLLVFDAAPDAVSRNCLAAHNFPLSEPVFPGPDVHNRRANLLQTGAARLVLLWNDVLRLSSVVKVLFPGTIS
jgi:transposase InsO family protein